MSCPQHWPSVSVFTPFPLGPTECDHWKKWINTCNPNQKNKIVGSWDYLTWPQCLRVCVSLCLHISVCVCRWVIFEAFMISEDVCYIGRGEKQYPLGNSSKKRVCFAPFSHLFHRFFLQFTLCFCLTYSTLKLAKLWSRRCLVFYEVLNAVWVSEIKPLLIGIIL